MTEDEITALETFSQKLAQSQTCGELIDAFEGLIAAVWKFMAPLVGDVGTRAIVNRAVQMASRDKPIVRHIQTGEKSVDFSELRRQAESEGCLLGDLLEGFIAVGVSIFRILAELAGDVLTKPLLDHLQKE